MANLTFYSELDKTALSELLDQLQLIDNLIKLQARVSLGLIDLSEERAKAVRRLNEAGIPVVAWLLLPKNQGYWFNAYNVDHAQIRYTQFRAWSAENRLKWDGIGLDIEPDYREMRQLIGGQVGPVVLTWLGRLFSGAGARRAHYEYSQLVDQIRADGYQIESYHLPFVVDERMAGSTLLQRVFGLITVPVDSEGLMLYSSLQRNLGGAIIVSYGPEAEMIAIGSTGGGVDIGAEVTPLTWEELARDLRLARQFTNNIAIFSLEGCVDQGFLSGLVSFDWEQPVKVSEKQMRQIVQFRRALRTLFWIDTHPVIFLSGLVVLLLAGVRLFRRLRR